MAHGANSRIPNQPEGGYQSARDFDSLLTGPDLGCFENAGLPGPLQGGFDPYFGPEWMAKTNTTFQPQDFNIGPVSTPSMNQTVSPSIPSHTVTQQYPWDNGNHIAPSNTFPNNFGAPLNTTGYPNPAIFTAPGQQVQSSNPVGNSQCSVPPPAQVAHGGRGATAQLPATRGTPMGIQSHHQSNGQTLPLAGGHFREATPSNGLQANMNPRAIPNHPRPEFMGNGTMLNNQAIQMQNGGPISTPLVNAGPPILAPALNGLNLGQENIDVPGWVTLIKPAQPAGGNVVTIRRDAHLALDIVLDRLPRTGYHGIKVPATASVKNYAETIGKTLLEFRIHLYGATTNHRYDVVCSNCQKREGKRRGIPGLIDFKTESDMLEPKNGKIRVEFVFCCYPKDHRFGDTEYFLDVVLSEDENQKQIVAQYQFPFSFNVVPRLPNQGKRKRQPEPGEPPPHEPPAVRRRMDDANITIQTNAPGYQQMVHLVPTIDQPDPPEGVHSSEGSSSSSPPLVLPPQQPQNVAPSPAPLTASKPPNEAIAPPRTEGESTPTLTEVNPESGSITGGTRIWLKGIDFPALFPLFARFGTAVVPTTFSNPFLLACNCPAAAVAGVVDVTLSRHPQPNAPEYGTSIAKFHYLADTDQLIPIVLRIHSQGYPELFPALQTLLTALTGGNRGLQGGSRGAGPGDVPIETALEDILSCLQTRSNFREILSTTNDHSQTLAHLSIFYGYPTLLRRLVDWGIDLTISDVNGLTALHCAYLRGDQDAVRTLRRGGALETATDKLGRTPSELQPEGFECAIDLDAEVAAGLDTEMYGGDNDIDEQLALGEQFSKLDSDDDYDSDYDFSDTGDDIPNDNDPEGMAVDSVIGGDEGGGGGGGGASGSGSGSGGGQVASGSREPPIYIMNQLLLEKSRRRKKNRGPQMFPDTPFDADISNVSSKLREAEAEPEAVDFLMRGIFTHGISLDPLKVEMTPQEVAEFHVPPGTLRYHALLRRDRNSRNREIVFCRLCPEDSQLDFKDPEEALHHIAEDHFEMGYSCDCGCNETYRTSADWQRHRKRKGLSLSQTTIVEA